MAFVKVKIPRTSQPQDACGIDWQNPLTRGLIALYSTPNGLQGVDGLGGTLTNLSAVGNAISPSGIGWKTASVGSEQALVLPNLTSLITTEASLVMPVSGGNMTTQGFAMLGPTHTGSGDHYPYANAIYTGALSATTRWVSGESPKVDITKPHVFAVQARRGQQRASQNGITLGAATLNEDPAIPAAPTLMRSSNTAYGYSGLQHALGLWNRYLADDEIKSLADNFWQIWEPEELTIWMPDEVGAGASTDALTSQSIATGSPAITLASLGQKHALVSQSVSTSAPTATQSAIKQIHALASQAIATAAPTVSQPALSAASSFDDLIAQSISTGAITVQQATLAQYHALTSQGINTAAPSVSQPTMGQRHGLAAQQISTAAPSISQPALSAAADFDNLTAQPIATGAPTLTSPTIKQVHGFAAGAIAAGQPQISAPGISQIHALLSQGLVTGAPVVSLPTVDAPVADFSPSIYVAVSPAQSYVASAPGQSYRATSPAQSYTATVAAQSYLA